MATTCFFLSEKQNNQSLIEFDLTEINRIDSAGFALLCDFLHDCEQLPNKKVRLINPPEQLLTLADLVIYLIGLALLLTIIKRKSEWNCKKLNVF